MISAVGINSVVGDLDLYSASIKASDNLMNVFNIFEENKSLPGIIVTEEDKFSKMLPRTKFYEAMSKQYMFELFSKRRVNSFFDDNYIDHSLFLIFSTPILYAANEALKREEAYRYDPIIVKFQDNNLKLLDFHKLLLAQTQVHLLTFKSLKEANEFKKDVLGMAAHDLRNPINAILGFSSLIRDISPKTDEIKNYANYINEAAQQMNDLLNELLNSAANDATELELNRIDFDLIPLIEGIINSFKQQALSKHQSIKFNWSADHIFINADKQKIKEVLENLISNAIKYSDKEKLIEVYTEKRDSAIVIKVKDEGPGFNDSDLKKIFKRFQRLSAKPTGNEPSTGLGLYIVKKIIEQHEGVITVDTEINKGSTFNIILPQIIYNSNNMN